jgi:hypothetical protein
LYKHLRLHAVLLHEILHVVLHHGFHLSAVQCLPQGYDLPRLFGGVELVLDFNPLLLLDLSS